MIPQRDLARWRDEVARHLLKLDFRAARDEPFRFQMSPILSGERVHVVHCEHGPGFTYRDTDLLKDGDDRLALVYPLRGRLSFSPDGGGELRQNCAKLLVCDKPGQLGAAIPCNYISILFQPDDLPAGTDITRLAKAPWHGAAPALRLLRDYVDSLKRSGRGLTPELSAVANRHILELVGLAARECSTSESVTIGSTSKSAEARLMIARADIARLFRDPDLSETTLATRQGISPRQLQRVFAAAGGRVIDEVNAMRLKAAFEALRHPASTGSTITSIALRSGFSDLSHFNRLFRRHFGVTPSDVRSTGC